MPCSKKNPPLAPRHSPRTLRGLRPLRAYRGLQTTIYRLSQQLLNLAGPLHPDDPARHGLLAAHLEAQALEERLWIVCHAIDQHHRLTLSQRK